MKKLGTKNGQRDGEEGPSLERGLKEACHTDSAGGCRIGIHLAIWILMVGW